MKPKVPPVDTTPGEPLLKTASQVLDLMVDPNRTHVRPASGIQVRARHPVTLKFQNTDIKHLERRSLIRWLAENPTRCRNTVLALLNYPTGD